MTSYVIRGGRLRKDEPYDPGTLIYYNDEVFQKGKKDVKNLLRTLSALCFAVMIGLLLLVFLVEASDGMPGIIGILSSQAFVILLLSNAWDKAEYGVCFYERGLDVPRPNFRDVDRIFIPIEEIRKVSYFAKNIQIRFRDSRIRGYAIYGKMVDEKGKRILDKLMQGYRLSRRMESPKLVLYSSGGRPIDTVQLETPEYDEPPAVET